MKGNFHRLLDEYSSLDILYFHVVGIVRIFLASKIVFTRTRNPLEAKTFYFTQ